ncbi:MAG: cytochrome c [Cytophagales bacterium]|nr:cytochrome c [Cytophagales bacterium]
MFAKNKYKTLLGAALIGLLLTSCYDPTQKAEEPTEGWVNNNTNIEYAPQMYHSEAYDPMSQILDTTAGLLYFKGEIHDTTGVGEFYNSNRYNPNRMNMRVPAANTIKRGNMPYSIEKEDWATAQKNLPPQGFFASMPVLNEDGSSTTTLTKEELKEAKALYLRFCAHCHGEKGNGESALNEKGIGAPAYGPHAYKPIGHLFHVITYGKGRMGAHASQLSQEERWKIAAYVQQLQEKLK